MDTIWAYPYIVIKCFLRPGWSALSCRASLGAGAPSAFPDPLKFILMKKCAPCVTHVTDPNAKSGEGRRGTGQTETVPGKFERYSRGVDEEADSRYFFTKAPHN